MGRPFSDIMRAEELMEAKTQYDAWLKKSRAEKSQLYQQKITQTGNRRSNVGKVTGYLIPFGVDTTKAIYARVKVLAPASSPPTEGEEAATTEINNLTTAIVGADKYATTTKPTTEGTTIAKVRNSELARVKYVEIGDTVPNMKSRITGRPYTYRRSDSVSCPFGRGIGGKSTLTSFEDVRDDIKEQSAIKGDGKRLYFTRQGNVDIEVV